MIRHLVQTELHVCIEITVARKPLQFHKIVQTCEMVEQKIAAS